MRSLAHKLEPRSVLQDAGTVVLREGDTFVVRTDTATLRATRAVSCLVEPEVGDGVLLSCVGEDCYVLAILERDARAGARLAVDGDLQVQVGSGRFELIAADGVRLVTKKDFSVASAAIDLVAERGAIAIGELAVLGAAVVAEVARVKIVAGAVESVFERTVQRVKRSFRFVDGLDQVKAESIDYRAEQIMNLQAENTLMTAKELVKVDGAQIHLG
jgi:hypothetical protein